MPTFRLPLSTPYNTRFGASTTDTTSAIAGVAMAGVAIAGKPTTAASKDGMLVNCMSITSAKGREKVICAVPRPGWETHTTPSAGNLASAILIWTGNGAGDKVITAFGATSTIFDGTASLGAITGRCTGITETITATNKTTIVMSSSDQSGWYMPSDATSDAFTGNTTSGSAVVAAVSTVVGRYTGQAITGAGIPAGTRILTVGADTITMTANATATATAVSITPARLARIIDVDFPGNVVGTTLVGTFAHIDGFAVIMTSLGVLWASELNTLTGWVATSFDSANAYPDLGVGLVRHKNFVMAFGTESTQFFYNSGLTPFPLSKSASMTNKVGAVHADAITSVSDIIFFAGTTPQGGISVFQYDGQLAKVSTPEIDSFLVLNGSTGITLTSLRFYGRTFAIINTGNYSLIYCVEEKKWHEWGATNKLWFRCVGASIGGTLLNYCISNTVAGGKVYKMDQAAFVYTDDGVAISFKINLPNDDFGTARKKYFSDIELIADIESGSCEMEISYTDDDFKTFTSLGTVNLHTARPRLTRAGSSRKRGWQLTSSSATKFRIEALSGTYEIGSS